MLVGFDVIERAKIPARGGGGAQFLYVSGDGVLERWPNRAQSPNCS